MVQKYKIVAQLFLRSFFIIAFLYGFVVVAVVGILSFKEAYKNSLENEFATKQPHIKLLFINNNQRLSHKEQLQWYKKIYSISDEIKNVSSFVSGKKFFTVTGFKMGGNAQYSGDVKIIGIDPQNVVYDFYSLKFIKRQPFEVAYTPVEFFYNFRKNTLVVFNEAFFNSFFPVIESTQNFLFRSKNEQYNIVLGGIFKDYDKKPIMYLSLDEANHILKRAKGNVDGFYINVKHLNTIDSIKALLEKSLPKDKFIVSSWLQERHKQRMMFILFETLAYIVVGVIILLAMLFILLLLYYGIVKKSYQLSVLYTLGYIIKKELLEFLIISVSIVDFIAILLLEMFLKKLILSFGLDYTSQMQVQSIIIIVVLSCFFVIFGYILIKKSYDLKTKSVF